MASSRPLIRVCVAGLVLAGGLSAALPASAPRAAPAGPAAPTTRAPAFTVAVLGDGFGEALDEGVRADLGQDAAVTIVSATHAPFGLANEQRFDWTAAVRTLLAERHIGAAVIMLGANDVRPLRDGTTTIEPGTPRWTALYGARVAAVADQFRSAGVPLTWVGLPIVADEETASGFAALNEIIRDRAIKAGARFVDSWGAFVDESGRFSADGPDRNGRQTRLRTDDGRDFTHDGTVKLASFVEGDLRHARDEATAALVATTDVVLPREPEFDNDVNAQIRRELGLSALAPATRDTKGPVIIVTAPPLSSAGHLVASSIGPAPLPNAGGMSLAQRALVEGRPVAPKTGRIDDFSWPRK